MPESSVIELKKRSAKEVLDKIARREELDSDELNETLRHVEKALEPKRRLTDEQLNRRAGY